jgi:hypothetical protein
LIIVIPSVRDINLEYLDPLIENGNRFIVVDDSDGNISISHPNFEVYNWNDRKRILGELDPWFPRKNGVCRDFGFYLAWRDSDDDEIIVALDDDCEVTDPKFGTKVIDALSAGSRPKFAAGEQHINIVDCYKNMPDDLFPRGFPYEHRKDYKPSDITNAGVETPAFNLGLWTDAFDVNAIDKLQGPKWRHPDAELVHDQIVVPKGSLVSACSMNMQFRRRLIPATYQWPMNLPVMPGWVIDRYGDIWGGFALKLLMDANDDCMTVGAPMIAHRKAGDMNRNMVQEHVAHFVNAEMIDLLIEASGEVRKGDYLSAMQDLIEGIDKRRENASPLLHSYLAHLVPAVRAWCSILAK